MRKIKILLAVLVASLMVTMSSTAMAQESGWYNYPDQGGWWYYWAETGEWQQDPGTQPATTTGSVCDSVDGRVFVNGYQIC